VNEFNLIVKKVGIYLVKTENINNVVSEEFCIDFIQHRSNLLVSETIIKKLLIK